MRIELLIWGRMEGWMDRSAAIGAPYLYDTWAHPSLHEGETRHCDNERGNERRR